MAQPSEERLWGFTLSKAIDPLPDERFAMAGANYRAELRSDHSDAALTIRGGYSRYICLPETELVTVPAGVDPASAVCLVMDYVVGYQMLHRSASLESGNRVLIHGASGGCGTALLQLGKLMGLRMFGTASRRNHGHY